MLAATTLSDGCYVPPVLRALVLLSAAGLAALAASPASARALATAIFDPFAASPTASAEFGRAKATGASFVRLTASWRATAPAAPAKGFAAADPSDPGYRWETLDEQIEAAVAAGLRPIVDIIVAPPWALEDGSGSPGTPVARDLGDFARAAATRYSGRFHGLPHVRYWQVWNEPNLTTQLSPQLVRGRPVAALAYRDMVNAVAAAVKGVSGSNVVVAGGVSPFRDMTPETYQQNHDWGPLTFMRAFFCLSPKLRSTCSAKARFDVWSLHPYTSGDPNHHAVLPDDVSLGDLPKLTAMIRAAVRRGHVLPQQMPQLWVTEFSWDSSPPDPGGVPPRLLKRWVPQSLYQAWRSGFSLFTWFQLNDQPLSAGPYQSGLHYSDGRSKPYLEGFRFPVVAFPRARGFYIWGRTPWSAAGSVAVEQLTGRRWRRVTTLHSDRSGIFQATLRGARTGSVRARLLRSGERSLAFSLARVPDHFYNPFGSRTGMQPGPR